MQTEQPDIDPSNIKPLSNEELTKLIVITNRMVGSLSSEVANLQTQLNELSNIILHSKLTDASKIAELAHVIEHGASVYTKPPVINLPISTMCETDKAMFGVSIGHIPPHVLQNSEPTQSLNTDVDNLTSNT